MKLHLILISLLLTALPSLAEYRMWTNKEGQKAELKLLAVKEIEGEKYGEFRMRDGRTTKLPASQLSEADAEFLSTWQPSVFEDILQDNLVKLEGDKFEAYTDHVCPEKYYVFYYTAKWCGPCQMFTPSLVKWYNQNKNDNFELVLISSDRNAQEMEASAKDKKMPWPQLAFKKAREFKTTHNHGVRGIPSLIVCDLDGKILGNYRSKLTELTELVK